MKKQLKYNSLAPILRDKISMVELGHKLQPLAAKAKLIMPEVESGPDYLQWFFPGDGWDCLANLDGETKNEAMRVLSARQEALTKLISNSELRDAVCKIPGEELVFVRQNDSEWDIALVAWGYQYPGRDPFTPPAIGNLPPINDKQKVQIAFDWDGKHLPQMPCKLKDQPQRTDDNGIFTIKDEVEVGYSFPIEVADKEFTLTVNKGQQLYTYDLTKNFNIEVSVVCDDKPVANTACKVNFGSKTLELTTDENGQASATLAFEPDSNGLVNDVQPECIIQCDGESQSQTPSIDNDLLRFNIKFVKPIIVEPKERTEEESNKEPKEEPAKKEISLVFLDRKGNPMADLEIHVTNKAGKQLVATTDEAGRIKLPRDEFEASEKPIIDFVISKEYQQKHTGKYK